MVKTNSVLPMPSLQDSQSPEMDSHISNTDSSSDFSVISRPPESQVTINGSLSGMNEFHYALSSPYSVDLTFEEMNTSIQRLLQENTELKSMVQRDHETMKKQYELMLQSKEHVERVMKQQQERREQAKNLVEQLQSENAALRSHLEKGGTGNCSGDYGERVQHLMEELASVKLLLNAKSDDHEKQAICNEQLQLELSELRNDISQQKLLNNRLLIEKRDLAAMNVELQAKCSVLPRNSEEFCETGDDNQDFLLMQPDVSKRNDKLQNQMSEEYTIKNLLQQLNFEQLKTQELETKLKEESAKTESLTRDLQGQEEVIRRLATTSQENYMVENNKLSVELDNSKRMLEKVQSALRMSQERCATLENQVMKLQAETQNAKETWAIKLQEQVELLHEERRTNELCKKKLKDTEAQLEALLNDHSQLQSKWEVFSQKQEDKEQQAETYYKLQIKALHEKLDSLTANLVETKDSLAEKEMELSRTIEEMEKLKLESETIPILQAQLEVYKGDFRAEREARENTQGEKERLLSDIRRLQGHVQMLEQTAMRSGSSSRGRGRHSSSARNMGSSRPEQESALAASALEEPSCYECPKCNLKFKDLQPLLNHVNQCLDREDPIP